MKIQNLTIQDLDNDENNDGENEGDMEENEQGEMVPKKKGPWKVIEHSDSVASNDQGKSLLIFDWLHLIMLKVKFFSAT